MKTRKLLFAFLLLAFLSSCGTAPALPPTPAPTRTPVETDSIATKPEDIAGIWKFSAAGVPWHIDFHPEGYAYSNRVVTKDKPWGSHFWFEGTVFHLEDLTCSHDGKKPTQGTYEAHIVQEDGQNYKLYFKLIEEQCKDRINEMKRGYIWGGSLR